MASAPAAASIDPDDVVVAELDVVLSNELAGLQSQLVMLQQPLRPSWRPYEADRPGTSAKFKPVARRLEISLPLDTKGENYGDVADEAQRIKTQELRSSPVDDPVTSYAVGVVRGNQLVLVPLDYTLQLRPNMAHLNDAGLEAPGGGRARRTDAGDSEEEEAAAGEEPVTAVAVTVKRRETERQQQARLRSFSHLQQEEQQEAWVPLKVVPSSSSAADNVWERLLAPPEQQQRAMPPPLPRPAYLQSFAPACAPGGDHAPEAAAAAAAAATAGGAPGAAGGAGAGGAGAANGASGSLSQGDAQVTPAMAAAVDPVIRSLFGKHPVCGIADVRLWMQQQEHEPQARSAALLPDAALHGLLTRSGHVRSIRRVYVAEVGANAAMEPLRKLVLRLLTDKLTLRKSDVTTAAREARLEMSEPQYQRVMRELCKNNGNHWTLKAAADL